MSQLVVRLLNLCLDGIEKTHRFVKWQRDEFAAAHKRARSTRGIR